MILDEETYLAHYGILRKSGRYPWGSGTTQNVRNKTYLDTISDLKKQGLSESEIAKGLGITTTQLRAAKTIALNQQKQAQINQAQRLKEKGMSNVAIGERMGINESSVRSLLAPGKKDKADVLMTTSNMLKDQLEKKEFLDIGSGVENHIGISNTKLAAAVALLKEEGYTVHNVNIRQLGTGKDTRVKVLAKPGVQWKDVINNTDKIEQINSYSENGGREFLKPQPPIAVSSKRVGVRYGDEGGAEHDGMIYVRPGVKDLSMGKSRYAQVRIAVDGTHYLKGMAIYKDDLPKGTDLLFNTNKKNTGNKLDALKEMKGDEENPFGATVRQLHDEHGKNKSAMNIVNEEGDWEGWSKSLSSQMLSKQKPELAKTQLNMLYERKRNDLDEIMQLTNPAVRKKLLESYADDVDKASVHLKAAAIPGQSSHVIIPVSKIKETEVYAPNYKDGEQVALVRFPHGGTFEIPKLTVNNKNPEAKKLLGNARDAVGIHHKVAERLSGADFDGDTVLVIPNNRDQIKNSPPLEGLKGFDPRSSFPPYHGMRTIDGGVYNAHTQKVDFPNGSTPKASNKGHQMGDVTNLISDMTIKGANTEELARAVRHSMVVIDSEKHVLDYKASAEVNGIRQLKARYQGGANKGASTLITKAGSETRVNERKPRPAKDGGPIDKVTGKKVFVDTGATYVDRKGNTVLKTVSSKKLAEVDDAHKLLSDHGGTPIERVYADHSNRLKALGNTARKEYVNTKPVPYSPSAKKTYTKEVESLNSSLQRALKNRPLERQAQIIANSMVAQKRAANPHMDSDQLKKIKTQALITARRRTGAERYEIEISPDEWHAIQAGAISNHKLEQILNKANLDTVRKLATPKTPKLMTSTSKSRATAMLNQGYTQAEVAAQLGVSLTTLKTGLSE